MGRDGGAAPTALPEPSPGLGTFTGTPELLNWDSPGSPSLKHRSLQPGEPVTPHFPANSYSSKILAWSAPSSNTSAVQSPLFRQARGQRGLHLLTHQETTPRHLLEEGAAWGPHRCPPCPKSAPQASTEPSSCTGSAVGESSLAPADPMAPFPHIPVIPHGTGGHCLHPPLPPRARFGDSGREAEPAPPAHSRTQLSPEEVRAELGFGFSSMSQEALRSQQGMLWGWRGPALIPAPSPWQSCQPSFWRHLGTWRKAESC